MEVFEFDENILLEEDSEKRGRPQGSGIRETMLEMEEGQGMTLNRTQRPHVTILMRELRILGVYFTTRKHPDDREKFNLLRISAQTYEQLKISKKNK